MAAIFISHANSDAEAVQAIKQRLENNGHRSLFIDYDPRHGIPAGRDWERDLYDNLRRCKAIVFVCSRTSVGSKWCFAELAHARAFGKPIFPLRIDDSDLDSIVTRLQAIDLTRDIEEGYERLWRGLREAGVSPALFEWRAKRSPYPGLVAFEQDDAAVFFGRDREVDDGVNQLNAIRTIGDPRLLLVLGGSGSGKSSFVRAGLVPRIRLDVERWVVVPPFRPRMSPIHEAARALSAAFAACGKPVAWRELAIRLQSGDDTVLHAIGSDLLVAARRPGARVLLVVDQMEELLTKGSITADGVAPAHVAEWQRDSDSLWRGLRETLQSRDEVVIVVGTLRADFFANLQRHAVGGGLDFRDLRLRRLGAPELLQIIRSPADLVGITVEDSLAEELVRDASSETTLPLLAFTLRELYNRDGATGTLTTTTYRRELGGIGGALGRAADAIFPSSDLLNEPLARAVRDALLRLVRVEGDGRYIRNPIREEEITDAARSVIQRLVAARILVAGTSGIEPAHEQLFSSWRVLAAWLAESHEFLLWRERVGAAARQWRLANRDAGALLRGALLVEAEKWMSDRSTGVSSADTRDFIEASVTARRRELDREQQQLERERTEAVRLARALAETYFVDGVRQVSADDPFAALACFAEALTRSPDNAGARASLVAALIGMRWPLVQLQHENEVIYAEFSPTATQVVTASADHTARIWNATTGAPIGSPLRHEKRLRTAAFSPDGRLVATAGEDGFVKIWSAVTGAEHGAAMQPEDGVVSLAFSPDVRTLVTASGTGCVQLWDLTTRKPVGATLRHSPLSTGGGLRSYRVFAVVGFAPDGTQLLTTFDREASLWSLRSRRFATRLMRHGAQINSARFSPNGRQALIASSDGVVRLWSTRTGKPVGDPLRHESEVNDAAFSPDGRHLVTACENGVVRIWDARRCRQIGDDWQDGGAVKSAAFSSDSSQVLTAHWDGKVRIRDTRAGFDVGQPMDHRDAVHSAIFDRDSTRILSVSSGNCARIWNARSEVALALPLPPEEVSAVALSRGGARLVTGDSSGLARIWDTRTGTPVGIPMLHQLWLNKVAFSSDGRHVLTASEDGTARIWDAISGQATTGPLRHEGEVLDADFSPDAALVATASNDKTLRIWDALSGEPITEPLAHGVSVQSVIFTEDGQYVMTTGWGDDAGIWDARTGRRVASLRERDGFGVVAFNRDGTLALLANQDGVSRLWDVQAGAFRGDPLVTSYPVDDAWFSPVGCRLLTRGNLSYHADLWDAATGRAIGEPLVHDALEGHNGVMSGGFSRDGGLVVTAGRDRVVRLWSAKTGASVGSRLQHDDLVDTAVFSDDGARLATVAGGRVLIWDVDVGCRSVSDMLLLGNAAVALCGYRLNEERALVSLKDRQARIAEIDRLTSTARDDTSVGRLIQWVISDPVGRSESPFSGIRAHSDTSAAAITTVPQSEEDRVPTSKRKGMKKMVNDALHTVAKRR